MMKKMKLADVPFGKNFEVWGHEYTVLDGDDKGVFVLETETVCEMPFREDEVDYKVAPNDFRDSSVRAYLEGRYTEGLVSAGAKLDEDILPMELDLKCTLGQHEYGTARVYAGLLTLEQQVRQVPGEKRLNQLHSELAGLRGDIMALNARITGLDHLLSRLERSLERQEERLRPFPARSAREAI